MTARNDLAFVREIMALLDDAGVQAWLFGGWAEELLGLAPARVHRDVDLLYPAADLSSADAFLAANGDLTEITQKRVAHKRAFLAHGIMVELILVQREAAGNLVTWFWGQTRYVWPADLLGPATGNPRLASAAALRAYRAQHADLFHDREESRVL